MCEIMCARSTGICIASCYFNAHLLTVCLSALGRPYTPARCEKYAPLPLCRDHDCPTGPLALVSAACPALRELEVEIGHLDQPPGPLAHLTRLFVSGVYVPPEGAAPLRRLAAAAPQLEVLEWGECKDPSMVAAADGHPCVRELLVLCSDHETWLRATPRLPAHCKRLSHLVLEVSSRTNVRS